MSVRRSTSKVLQFACRMSEQVRRSSGPIAANCVIKGELLTVALVT